MEKILRTIEKLLPKKLFKLGQPIYHYGLALLGAIIYRLPSRKIKVVAVTGTKGKTSTVEFINAILEEAGFKTAVAGTLRFKLGDNSRPNSYKMTMPGRFFIQRFLRQAVNADCNYAVIEISSEASKQFRHKFIDLDGVVFTNLAPEHIESHGSYEHYVNAKLNIARALKNSCKSNTVIAANIDDKEGHKFLNLVANKKAPYSIRDGEPVICHERGSKFVCENIEIDSKMPGQFNVYNMLAAIAYTRAIGIDMITIKKALEKVTEIKGRIQKIKNIHGLDVYVDYAHTADSLKALYETFAQRSSTEQSNKKLICVLGNCGGGRDKWKRPLMAQTAEKYCDTIILTDEDPYDDDPREIVNDMARAITQKEPLIIMDRRQAIAESVRQAKLAQTNQNTRAIVLITGKGTDPYIMRANGKKETWSDAKVTEEELSKLS